MKKLILTLMFCFITSFSFANLTHFNNAKTLHIYLRENFEYKTDRIYKTYWEYFQTPSVFQFTKQGDCDDFAIYTTYYLKKMNYESHLFTIIAKFKEGYGGHAITVFKEKDNTYSIFSNQWIVSTKETDPISAIKSVYKEWVIINYWIPQCMGNVRYYQYQKDIKRIAIDVSRYTEYKTFRNKTVKQNFLK